MSLSLSLFLYLFLFFALVFLIFSFFNMYHVFRFGFITPVTITMLVTYILVSVALLVAAGIYISRVDWSAMVVSL